MRHRNTCALLFLYMLNEFQYRGRGSVFATAEPGSEKEVTTKVKFAMPLFQDLLIPVECTLIFLDDCSNSRY